MKMQNTEMEFVAFDAQDVIATSLDVTDYYGVTVTGRTSSIPIPASSFLGGNQAVTFEDAYAGLGNFESGSSYSLVQSNVTSAGVYVVTGIKESGNSGFEFIYTPETTFLASNPDAKNNLYSKATTGINAVLQWLVDNMSLIQ